MCGIKKEFYGIWDNKLNTEQLKKEGMLSTFFLFWKEKKENGNAFKELYYVSLQIPKYLLSLCTSQQLLKFHFCFMHIIFNKIIPKVGQNLTFFLKKHYWKSYLK